MGSSSGRSRLTPPSAGLTSTPPGPAKGGCRSGPGASERPRGRAGRPRFGTLARRTDHQDSPRRRRLLPRPRCRHHRRPTRRRARLRAGDEPNSCPPDQRWTPPHPARSCACQPGVLLPSDSLLPAQTRDRAHHPGGARPGRTPTPPRFRRRPSARLRREMYKRRHKVECRIGLLKQARGVATRYDKLAVRYESTVQLTLIRQAL